MGVMGKALALNCAEKGINVSVYNRFLEGYEEKIASQFAVSQTNYEKLQGFDELEKFVVSLPRPRIILLMIKAGYPVDVTIDQLTPLLDQGDVLIDGGNSLFEDTNKRFNKLKNLDIYYVGMGISGGEEGALKGPSLMPGGSERGFILAQPLLNKISAVDNQGNPCCAYIGPEGAGHYVKMVHNGIEYAEMQLLAETYLVLKEKFDLKSSQIAEFFQDCKKLGVNSYLIDITADIFGYLDEDEKPLIEKVLDKSEQKGTGKWVVESALDLGGITTPIAEAVFARYISSEKDLRIDLSKTYTKSIKKSVLDEQYKKEIIAALNCARIINHISAFDLMLKASDEYKWKLNLSEIAHVWTNGCIIRSGLMETLMDIYANTNNGWTHDLIVKELDQSIPYLQKICVEAISERLSIPVLSSALNIFNGLTTKESTANLIQAQRDYFGAHTFQRIDKEGYFHSSWK